MCRIRSDPTVPSASCRRGQSAALFAETRATLARIREAGAAGSLAQDLPGSTDMPGRLASLRALRDACATRADLYQRAAGLLSRQEALWEPGGQQETLG